MTISTRSHRHPGTQPVRIIEQADREPHRRTAVFAVTARTDSVPTLRHLTCQTSRRWNLPDAVEEALALVVTELVTNAVRHSGSPAVTMLLTADDHAVTLQVKDSGRWRHRRGSRRTGGGDSRQATGGRGLQLVTAYASKLTVRRTRTGTLAVAVIALNYIPKEPFADDHARCEQAVTALGPTGCEHAHAESTRPSSPRRAVALARDAEPAARSRIASAASPSPLTPRELEVAGQVAEGMANKQIAATPSRSQRTIDTHVQNIPTKLGFRSRTQIAAWWTTTPIQRSA